MYTRGGDKGETGLYGPKRVAKDSPRVEAYGTVDELNSCIGVAISSSGHEGGLGGAEVGPGEAPRRRGGPRVRARREGAQDRVPRIGVKDTQEARGDDRRTADEAAAPHQLHPARGDGALGQPPPRPVGLQEGREDASSRSRRRRRSTRNSSRSSTGSRPTCSTRRRYATPSRASEDEVWERD